MRKIMIHAGMSPLEQPPLRRVFSEHLFTTNSGNLMFQYGVYRTLMTEDTEFVTAFLDHAKDRDALVARANGECACVVLPMANNFRGTYNLKTVTRFVEGLKVPCVVIGIGLQARDADVIRDGFSFDGDVKEFVSTVLDHSAMLGLRGELTAEYLKRLGFAPERHFTIVGCPSMYSRGGELPRVRPLNLTGGSRVNLNYRIDQPAELARLLEGGMRAFPNYSIVVQRREEMAMLRYHTPLKYTYDKANACVPNYPHDYTHPALREGRMLGFASARAWMDYMGTVDFNMGSRIHGNIAAVLGGAPTLCVALDTRMEELCRYHRIPFIPAKDIDPDRDPRSFIEGVDFDSVHQGHTERFRHFVDFLNANGLRHVYSDSLTPGQTPFDRAEAALPAGWGRIAAEPTMPASVRLELLGTGLKRGAAKAVNRLRGK